VSNWDDVPTWEQAMSSIVEANIRGASQNRGGSSRGGSGRSESGSRSGGDSRSSGEDGQRPPRRRRRRRPNDGDRKSE